MPSQRLREERAMIGAIRTRDILFHPLVTIQCFGWQVFLRTLFAGPHQTFLSVLRNSGFLAGIEPVKKLDPIHRCVALELQLKRIYESLADRFAGEVKLVAFLKSLSMQEQGHAELLEVCRAAMRRSGPLDDRVPTLEKQMADIFVSLDSVVTVEKALRLVLEMESSEINRVFLGVIGAAESSFVKRLEPFRESMVRHIAFISEQIVLMSPENAEACCELREKFTF
jgi:rubrerythrin